ncbi:tetratricopeptide repeat protein [Desulfonatronovibrio magnus]|uniref:tetratricopeptide repeat protein n=1 Tax=Desulfonatronovibrio magnus TaxID=698827 RepID=UPI0005EB5E0E|nr:hypothetical protein [Desulfonatronovibrio magnus]
MSNTLISPSAMQKSVAIMAVVCLIAIFLSSLMGRVKDPSITVVTSGAQRTQEQAMMAEISGLMAEVDRNPDNVPAMIELAHLFMLMDAWERSYAFWNRILAIEPENELALNQAGFTLFQLERFTEAEERFQALLDLDPDNYRSHYNLGIMYKYYLDDQEKAEHHFHRILEIAPEDPELIQRIQHELDNPVVETE